jgi:hypothetical protein
VAIAGGTGEREVICISWSPVLLADDVIHLTAKPSVLLSDSALLAVPLCAGGTNRLSATGICVSLTDQLSL